MGLLHETQASLNSQGESVNAHFLTNAVLVLLATDTSSIVAQGMLKKRS